MADLIAHELSIDVIALQEINTEFDGRVRKETFSLEPWHELQMALKARGYQMRAGNSGHAQHIVFAWRKPVEALQLPEDLAVADHYEITPQCRTANLRQPLAGLFRANHFDFWAIGLHLKANNADSNCPAAIRVQQIDELLNASKELTKRDTDIILIGDFNSTTHHKSLHQLFDQGFLALDDKEYRNPASSNHSYHSANSKNDMDGSLIDHIMVKPDSLNAWQSQSTSIYKPEDAGYFTHHYSDHRPIWSDFSTRKGNDHDNLP